MRITMRHSCAVRFMELGLCVCVWGGIFNFTFLLYFQVCQKKKCKVENCGCDQCVWAVGVVAGYSHWVGH